MDRQTITSRRRMLVMLPLLRFSFLSRVKAQEGPIRVDVNLVNLYVAVSDSAGKPVDGLRKENFRIWEDSVEQGISHFSSDDVPFTVGLILDRSGSMQDVIDDVYKAALHTVEASTVGDEAFVIVFNDRIELLQEFTSDHKTLQRAASKLRAGGQTALYDAVYTGLRHIQRGKNRKKALLVVTDGADNSSETQFRELLDAARQSEVILHVIGLFGQPMRFGKLFEDGPQVDKLSQLAAVTGGRADFPKNMEQCRQACINVARELHRQYSIGYYPTNAAKDGTWRSIRIELVGLPPSTGDGIARTREGYYVPREAPK
ncbi:MAG TPA: VWA domain-containing protein [Terriglobales bacterium]|nr:VWA domain-containing protein [Terriglobales bacterium]